MKKVLVAGATGYLGRFVVLEFKKRSFWVRALARNPEKLTRRGPFLEPDIHKVLDDLFVGEVTTPETLKGVCDNIDIVFSSIGITHQKERFSFRDVNYQGNKNLLEIALYSGVKKFVFVSAFDAYKYEHYLAGVKAKEDFVRELRRSGISYLIIRPTGFFSDMSVFFNMARRGRVFLIGKGENQINPIHGADLAEICVRETMANKEEIGVGGPEIYTYREIAELAFKVLSKKTRIISIPPLMVALFIKLFTPFNKRLAEMLKFLSTVMQNNFVANVYGKFSLKDHYIELIRRRRIYEKSSFF